MMVYGDPRRVADPAALITRLIALARRLRAAASLGELRSFLIGCGELEQAAFDAAPREVLRAVAQGRPRGEWERTLAAIHEATSEAGVAFHALWRDGATTARRRKVAREALENAEIALEAARGFPGSHVIVKVPEGYAFYALFPEQYCAAAERWCVDHAGDPRGEVMVLGVRTIGTSLAAVVRATLAANGWAARSWTVRPEGHPFMRHVATDLVSEGAGGQGLVVDEGPGLSGSSIHAAARALVRAGWRDIAVLAGHDHGPNGSVTHEIRKFWARVPCYAGDIATTRVDGRLLIDTLVAEVTAAMRKRDALAGSEDLGGGRWRAALIGSAGSWPAVISRFERPKFMCRTQGGRSLLFKFAGLSTAQSGNGETGAELEAARLAARAAAGWGVAPVGVAHGFVCLPWVDGRMLSPEPVPAARRQLVEHCGEYAAAVAGEPLDVAERDAAHARLHEMLIVNTREALGERAARAAEAISAAAERTDPPARRYGDGHLAPCEWLKAPSGSLIKTGGLSRDGDHTLIGPQPVAWDLASAMVEWDLGPLDRDILLDSFERAGGEKVPLSVLEFHRLAYAAFRAGQYRLCADSDGPEEKARLEAAYRARRAVLARGLGMATAC